MEPVAADVWEINAEPMPSLIEKFDLELQHFDPKSNRAPSQVMDNTCKISLM